MTTGGQQNSRVRIFVVSNGTQYKHKLLEHELWRLEIPNVATNLELLNKTCVRSLAKLLAR